MWRPFLTIRKALRLACPRHSSVNQRRWIVHWRFLRQWSLHWYACVRVNHIWFYLLCVFPTFHFMLTHWFQNRVAPVPYHSWVACPIVRRIITRLTNAVALLLLHLLLLAFWHELGDLLLEYRRSPNRVTTLATPGRHSFRRVIPLTVILIFREATRTAVVHHFVFGVVRQHIRWQGGLVEIDVSVYIRRLSTVGDATPQ